MYAAVGAWVHRVSTHGWMDGYVVGWTTVYVDMSVHRCRRNFDEPLLDSILDMRFRVEIWFRIIVTRSSWIVCGTWTDSLGFLPTASFRQMQILRCIASAHITKFGVKFEIVIKRWFKATGIIISKRTFENLSCSGKLFEISDLRFVNLVPASPPH